MSIEKLRSSLNSDDRKVFDKAFSNFHREDNVKTEIIGFDDPLNFIIKSDFDTKPYTGLVFVRDGLINNSYCY